MLAFQGKVVCIRVILSGLPPIVLSVQSEAIKLVTCCRAFVSEASLVESVVGHIF